jgi:putative flippase GtrA
VTKINSKRIKEFIKFAINGGISFAVDFGILYVLTEFCGVYYLISAAVSFTASVVVNYVICVLWVFEGAKNTGSKAKFIFIASSVIGLGFNQILMWLFVSKFGIYYMTAKIIATIIVMFWNYIAKRKAIVNN